MELLQKIQETFLSFEKKEFYKNTGIFFGIIFAVIGSLLYFHYSKTASLMLELKKVNRSRTDAQIVLEKYQRVKKQSEEVNSMLNEEKNFKIKNFFDGVVAQQKLKSNLKNEADLSDKTLYKRYIEVQLTAQFKQISTKQLCELLNTIEEKNRVYTKELIITKTKGASLDVTLTIATLKPQTDGSKAQ